MEEEVSFEPGAVLAELYSLDAALQALQAGCATSLLPFLRLTPLFTMQQQACNFGQFLQAWVDASRTPGAHTVHGEARHVFCLVNEPSGVDIGRICDRLPKWSAPFSCPDTVRALQGERFPDAVSCGTRAR